MKQIKNKKLGNRIIKMTHFVDYQNRRVIFYEWFLKQIKDMNSAEFKIYMEVMNKTAGFEVITVK